MAVSLRRRQALMRLEQIESNDSAFELASHAVNTRSTATKRRNKNVPTLRLGFASMTASGAKFTRPTREGHSATATVTEAQQNHSGKRGNPVAFIASAAESAVRSANIPSWRYTVGDLAAGATAGCAVEAALYPIDTIKTRLQNMRHGGGMAALFKQGGGKALYAGIWGNLVGVAPASAIFMAVYEPIKAAVRDQLGAANQGAAPLVAGALAGVAASVVRVPTEVIKQRMQTGEFKRAVTAIKTIAGREGLRGLYAGYGAFMLRDLPFDAVEFFAYEQMKRAWMRAVDRDLQPLETSACGAIAGAAAGLTTTPFDVLKTRLMTQGANGQYKNFVDATVQIAREEGLAAFMRGWQARVMWISIGGCVFFTALEASKKLYAPKEPVVAAASKK